MLGAASKIVHMCVCVCAPVQHALHIRASISIFKTMPSSLAHPHPSTTGCAPARLPHARFHFHRSVFLLVLHAPWHARTSSSRTSTLLYSLIFAPLRSLLPQSLPDFLSMLVALAPYNSTPSHGAPPSRCLVLRPPWQRSLVTAAHTLSTMTSAC